MAVSRVEERHKLASHPRNERVVPLSPLTLRLSSWHLHKLLSRHSTRVKHNKVRQLDFRHEQRNLASSSLYLQTELPDFLFHIGIFGMYIIKEG